MKFNVLLATLLCLGVFTANAQKNLVTNGGFEDQLFGWSEGGAKLTAWDVKGGKASAVIISTTRDGWAGTDQLVKLPKQTKAIEVGGWLKTNNVVKGSNAWDGAIFSIEFTDGSGKKISDGINIATLTGDTDWQEFKKEVAVPASAAKVRLLLALGNASGSILMDDIWIKVVASN